MVESVARCPYCVLGDNFKEMVAHLDGRMVCRKCGPHGHTGRCQFQVLVRKVLGDEVSGRRWLDKSFGAPSTGRTQRYGIYPA